jgi:hypothetical protein
MNILKILKNKYVLFVILAITLFIVYLVIRNLYLTENFEDNINFGSFEELNATPETKSSIITPLQKNVIPNFNLNSNFDYKYGTATINNPKLDYKPNDIIECTILLKKEYIQNSENIMKDLNSGQPFYLTIYKKIIKLLAVKDSLSFIQDKYKIKANFMGIENLGMTNSNTNSNINQQIFDNKDQYNYEFDFYFPNQSINFNTITSTTIPLQINKYDLSITINNNILDKSINNFEKYTIDKDILTLTPIGKAYFKLINSLNILSVELKNKKLEDYNGKSLNIFNKDYNLLITFLIKDNFAAENITIYNLTYLETNANFQNMNLQNIINNNTINFDIYDNFPGNLTNSFNITTTTFPMTSTTFPITTTSTTVPMTTTTVPMTTTTFPITTTTFPITTTTFPITTTTTTVPMTSTTMPITTTTVPMTSTTVPMTSTTVPMTTTTVPMTSTTVPMTTTSTTFPATSTTFPATSTTVPMTTTSTTFPATSTTVPISTTTTAPMTSTMPQTTLYNTYDAMQNNLLDYLKSINLSDEDKNLLITGGSNILASLLNQTPEKKIVKTPGTFLSQIDYDGSTNVYSPLLEFSKEERFENIYDNYRYKKFKI